MNVLTCGVHCSETRNPEIRKGLVWNVVKRFQAFLFQEYRRYVNLDSTCTMQKLQWNCTQTIEMVKQIKFCGSGVFLSKFAAVPII